MILMIPGDRNMETCLQIQPQIRLQLRKTPKHSIVQHFG